MRLGGWKANGLLLVVATAASLYAAEAFLIWWDRAFVAGVPVSRVEELCPGPASNDPRCLAAIRQGAPFDPRTPLEVFNDHAARGDTLWPAVPARTFRPGEGLEVPGEGGEPRTVLPLAGISEVETLLCNESGQWVTYRADEHGFNNPPGLQGRDDVAVALVGDSYVHGWCVPRPETLAGQLEPGHGAAINLGLEGSGPLSHLAILREYGADLAPPLVLWFFFAENDTDDLRREHRAPLLRSYLDPSFRQGLKELQPELDSALRSLILELRTADDAAVRRRARRAEEERLGRGSQFTAWTTLTRIRGRVTDLFTPPGAGRSYPWNADLFTRVMTRARDDVAAWGGQLVFVYLPSWLRIVPQEGATPHKDEILAVVAALGIPVVDPTPALLAHPDPERLFPFGLSGHFTAEGFRVVTREVEAYLDSSSQGTFQP